MLGPLLGCLHTLPPWILMKALRSRTVIPILWNRNLRLRDAKQLKCRLYKDKDFLSLLCVCLIFLTALSPAVRTVPGPEYVLNKYSLNVNELVHTSVNDAPTGLSIPTNLCVLDPLLQCFWDTWLFEVLRDKFKWAVQNRMLCPIVPVVGTPFYINSWISFSPQMKIQLLLFSL